jgi:hypothetical protein
MPFALWPFCPQLTTHNIQPTKHNLQSVADLTGINPINQTRFNHDTGLNDPNDPNGKKNEHLC